MKVGGGSDSKKEIGSGVTGEITNDSMYCCRNKSKLRKLDSIQPALNTFLVPCPIKDTYINAISINETGVPKILETGGPKIDNIKETGKVTAVVAVTQVNLNQTKDRNTGKKQDRKLFS